MNKLFSGFYVRLTLVVILVMLVVGSGHIFLTRYYADRNFKMISQKLHGNLAGHLLQETTPFVEGKVNKEALDHIMHYMMAINPSIEIYLLDTQGKILSYVAPHKKIKLDEVNLNPVLRFLDAKGDIFIKGEDPRNPGVEKIFSAVDVVQDGQLQGYIYIILMSEEFEAVAESFYSSFISHLGSRSFILIMLFSTSLALLLTWGITRYLRTIIKSVQKFKDGDLYVRIPVKNDNELNQLAIAFNEMAETILANIEKIKTVESLRRELVANVSHDLRTPLSIIHGYLETLVIKSDISEYHKNQYIQRALESTEGLKKLVEDLFELSKLEASDIKPKKEDFLITDLVQDVSQKYQLLAEEKGITLKPLFTKNLPLVHADIELIERVLQNLLDNALKFTPKGGRITLEASALDKCVEVKVSDTGEGIPETSKTFIFDRYHKVTGKSNIGGTGLGLAIVKQILDLHQATIGFVSEAGKGTTFYFDLPVSNNSKYQSGKMILEGSQYGG